MFLAKTSGCAMSLSLSTLKRVVGVFLFITLAVGSGIAVMSMIHLPAPHHSAGKAG